MSGFVNMSYLTILQYLFTRYGAIDDTDLEENLVNMMGLYGPAEPLTQLVEK